MVGGESTTTILKAGQLSTLPALSRAEQLTCVVPSPKTVPEAGEQDLDAIPELSTASNVQETEAVGVLPFEGETVNGDKSVYGGHVSVGEVASVF